MTCPCGDLAGPQEGSGAAASLCRQHFPLKVWKQASASLGCLGLRSGAVRIMRVKVERGILERDQAHLLPTPVHTAPAILHF